MQIKGDKEKCIITTQKKITDELSMQITIKDNIWLSIGLTLLISPVESPSYHNGFSLDLNDHKHKNGVTTDLFCTGVIGHPGHMFLN